ncbi:MULTISPECIES: S4A5 electrogenic sodium bicarbonate cotransporter 4 [unclassified Adlercreutzia]|uniref:S4A5 electrogenic sodium bicarbonate cotransporter 4 n=1 Tax=unclassified Adlercreutzia TaxID=2636013 RepID=UPI0013EDFAD9|nr:MULTISPECIES: S4A5 electrogenic sodium bicarbonate cotransporter 4 [unclassified Adlercreutzia]
MSRNSHAGQGGSVRIGPVSLFSLVIVLCLAVMAVLAVTTAQAAYSAAEKQARFTTDTYVNEQAAQGFVAEVDGALAAVRAGASAGAEGDTASAALLAVQDVISGYEDAYLQGSQAFVEFTCDSGRTLSVVLTIRPDATYEISQWRATTQWNEAGSGEVLWSGSAQSR